MNYFEVSNKKQISLRSLESTPIDSCGFEGDDVAEIRRVKRTFVLVLIDWLLGGHLRAVEDGALALAVLNLVKDALQAFVLVPVFDIEHVRYYSRFGNYLEQHDTGFLVKNARTKRTPERSQSEGDQFLIVCRSDGERYQFGEVVLLYIRSEG